MNKYISYDICYKRDLMDNMRSFCSLERDENYDIVKFFEEMCPQMKGIYYLYKSGSNYCLGSVNVNQTFKDLYNLQKYD